VAIRAGGSLEDIPCNHHRLFASLTRNPVPVRTSQGLARSPQPPACRLWIIAKQAGAVEFDEYLQNFLGFAVRDFPFGIVGVEIEGMAAAAMLVHRNRDHAGATGFDLMAIGTDQDPPIIRRLQSFLVEMDAVIKLEPRTVCQVGIIKRDSLYRPFGIVVTG